MGLRNLRSAWKVALRERKGELKPLLLVLLLEEDEEDEEAEEVLGDLSDIFWTICAFCLSTSAGVRMKQETSSAVPEAAAWTSGVGSRVVPFEEVFSLPRADLVAS